MTVDENRFFRFGTFRLDSAERELWRGDEVVPLTPKAFDTLVYLVRNDGHLVTKDELMTAVWPESFVDEANLPRTIYTLRRTLGDDGNGNSFIRTVPTKGYRFVAPVTQESASEMDAALTAEPPPLKIVERPAQIEATAAGSEPASTVVRFPPVDGKEVRNLTIAAGAFGAMLVVLWFIFGSGPVTGGRSNEIKSIAVLPVRSLTDQNRDPIYELGIAESLIARLSPAKNLIVRQLDAVKAYDGVDKNVFDIGKEQKVDYVLASNYQVADNKIRITSQLIKVSTGSVEEVFKSDIEGPDRFTVQDAAAIQIGNSVLKRLNREAVTASPKRYTANEEAYSWYLLGTALADSRDQEKFPKAVEYFEKAVKLDPKYALAYAGLANAHTAMGLFGGEKGAYEYYKAKTAIEQALAIDDTLAEAHTYLGEMKFNNEWDFEGAEREYKRGIELDPNSSAAHRMYALMLGVIGRTEEAVREINTAIDLEPASALNHKVYTHIAYFGRRYDDTIVEGRRALEIDPHKDVVFEYIIDASLQKREYDQAFEWFIRYRDLSGDAAGEIQAWKETYAHSGWRGVRERLIGMELLAEKKGTYNPVVLARLYSRQGEIDRAFEYIEKAFAMRHWGARKLIADPTFDPLRSDPRFAGFLARLNVK